MLLRLLSIAIFSAVFVVVLWKLRIGGRWLGSIEDIERIVARRIEERGT